MGTVVKGEAQEIVREKRTLESWLHVFGWALIGVISFAVAAYAAGLVLRALLTVGVPVTPRLALGQLLLGVLLYGGMASALMGVAWWRRKRFTVRELGVARLLTWRDMGFALAGVVLYLILTIAALKLATFIPGFDVSQAQDTGLGAIYGWERAVAFFSLVVFTPVAEEIIFRGMIYGRMRRAKLPWWVSAVVLSVLFGVAHLQWNVGLDVFCLSLVLCALREVTGSIWAGVLVHILKNAIAFFIVYGVMGF